MRVSGRVAIAHQDDLMFIATRSANSLYLPNQSRNACPPLKSLPAPLHTPTFCRSLKEVKHEIV
jgi:hypothetical protein